MSEYKNIEKSIETSVSKSFDDEIPLIQCLINKLETIQEISKDSGIVSLESEQDEEKGLPENQVRFRILF